MHRGWIKQYRKETDSAIWLKPPLYSKVWLWLKLTADRKSGVLKTTYNQMAEALAWHERGVLRRPNRKTLKVILEWLESNANIALASNRHFTTISLLNWYTYNPPADSEVTQNGHAEVTQEGQRTGQRIGHLTRSTRKKQQPMPPEAKPEPGEIPGQAKGGMGCFDLIGFINDTMGGTGIPPNSQRDELTALIDKWGYDRIKSAAIEQAPAMDNKTWGYRIAVLRNNAEPKAPPVKCPNCGRFPTGTKILRIPQNYIFYEKATNPTYDLKTWEGRPHWYCRNCSFRIEARPGEFEKAKAEAKERKNRRGRTGSTPETPARLGATHFQRAAS